MSTASIVLISKFNQTLCQWIFIRTCPFFVWDGDNLENSRLNWMMIRYRTRKGESAGCVIGCGYFVAITLFACSTCTRAEYVISARTSRKWKHCLPYIRQILLILFYNVQNRDLSIMNKRLHQTVACPMCIFWNDALMCLVISLKFINTKFVHSLLNSITTPCMVLLLLPEVPAGERAHPYQLRSYPTVPLSRCPTGFSSGSSRQPSATPP